MNTDREITLRITLIAPPPGVQWALQLGRSELMPPTKRAKDLEFEVVLRVVTRTDGEADFRGDAVQGPKNGRFIYLNSGTRAGQAGSPWDRRAKVSLEALRAMVMAERSGKPVAGYSAEIAGTDRHGGPVCASVPLSGAGWTPFR